MTLGSLQKVPWLGLWDYPGLGYAEGLKDLEPDQRKKIRPWEAVTYHRLYRVVLGQGCMRGEIPHSICLSRSLRHRAYHPEGEVGRGTPGGRGLREGLGVSRWCHLTVLQRVWVRELNDGRVDVLGSSWPKACLLLAGGWDFEGYAKVAGAK